jgi:hypothetical protein
MLAALVTTAQAQSFDWQRQPTGVTPTARAEHAMAHDEGNGRIVLFGGGDGAELDDTWLWNAGMWSQANPAAAPTARRGHAMAYDAFNQRIVMFGGFATGSGQRNDTWLWDGVTWTQATPASSPSPRSGHAMVYDRARQRVVLFGGNSGGVQSNETWEWNGTAWQAIASTSNPVARAGHAMSYDTVRQRVVMFGGNNTGIGMLADTWEWNGTLWVPAISANFPPARSGHAMAYDGLLARTILFGGNTGSNVAETWQWDGTNWTQITPLIGQPAPRTETALAYSADDQQLMFFGGNNGGGLPDTWIAGNSTTTYGAGCGSPALGFVPGPTPPYVGQTATATITNASTPIAAVAIGLSREFFGPFPLPLPLDSYGMTGCEMWQSSDIVGLPVGVVTPSSLSFTVALPNVQGLVGRHLYGQAFAFAPAQNPLGVVASNGVDWLVGCPPMPPMTLVEDFTSSQQLDMTASAGQWFNGMGLFAKIGGDARHGDFDISLATDTGEILNGQRVYELDCDHTVIPASQSTSGTEMLVTDGRFYFGTMTLPADVHLRIVGNAPPIITVAGAFTIAGIINVSGSDVEFHQATQITGQTGGGAGVFGGAGGNGGDKCLGVGPGQGQYNGRDGEAARVLTGHAYATATTATAGRGSLLYPASGLNADQQFGSSPPIGFFQPGMSGQVLAILSGGTPLPNQASFMGPPSAGGAAMQILPLPATSISSQHFLLGGAGGGGAASNCSLSLSLARSWASGAAGGGGGGAMALRAGDAVYMLPGSRLLAKGGNARDYIGTSASAQVAPGGGGSGGSILVQAVNPSIWQGDISLAGGKGGIFKRTGGSGIGPVGGVVEIRGGDGSPGYLRYEVQSFVPQPALLGVVEPPATSQNVGQLLEVDDTVSVRSKFYSTNLACSPKFVRYELDATANGVPTVYSDDPAISPLAAGLGAAVRVMFQAGNANLVTGEVQPIGPWRKSVRSAPGISGIDVDGGNAYRFMLVADRNVASTLSITRMAVVYEN